VCRRGRRVQLARANRAERQRGARYDLLEEVLLAEDGLHRFRVRIACARGHGGGASAERQRAVQRHRKLSKPRRACGRDLEIAEVTRSRSLL